MKLQSALLLTLILLVAACKPAVKPKNLYGKWKYIRVRNPNASPPDSVGAMTLLSQKPFIQFTAKDSLLIYWDGKVLSHGTFTMDGSNILYTEIIPGGTRKFPFYIERFDGKQLIFSTKGTDGSEVTAVKE
ncbi:hypothetical protein [Mucilaginibacter sp. UR6-11]|uniref:hypothetical protein n=1 Tax=Mucilaginibacter sp. UR6-11 TaxID=1435644 RepID=UPI001E5A6244|nr:hypothetical protein [Mucilaginibacter sp. UR6-11]MCC8425655.1 hypothetical protein [Mucilaginibacter sp. UR6-11]